MVTGYPLHLDGYPVEATPATDTRSAASRILAAYLGRLEFVVQGEPVRRFRLNEVREQWPSAEVELIYPAASIVAPSDHHVAHSLTPTPIECSWDREAGTMLWKTGDVSVSFQVDFWCTTEPDREAIAARLPAALSPGEGRYGVILSGVPDYWDLPARATLEAIRRIDTGDTVPVRERRLMAKIRVDLDVVHLRSVRPLEPAWSPISAEDNS